MAQVNFNSDMIAEVFKKHCHEKNYQFEDKKDSSDDWRLTISDAQNRVIVNVYHTRNILVQGKNTKLKAEFEELKNKFQANPGDFLEGEVREIRACQTRYDILLPQLREKIKECLNEFGNVDKDNEPTSAVEYRARMSMEEKTLTLTQYKNGTLLLQGKEDTLFHNICDCIEKVANPSEKEVIARFISSDEENLEIFSARYTPKLLEMAEKNVREALGDVNEYVEEYDQKWFVASECLCLSQIPFPEFSPLVMPASKAFEGFLKKLLVGIGLFEVDHFKTKGANFSALNNVGDLKRKSICDKEIHADTMLKKIDLCLKTYRHFMMHSDESKITKVNSAEEGREKVNTIFKEAKEIFEYFNELYNLIPS